MPDQGESYPGGLDIRKREGQGEMMGKEAERKGIDTSDITIRQGDESLPRYRARHPEDRKAA